MYSRWFSTAVVLLWLSTMGWLVKEKVLPPLLLGDPPSHQSILEARRGRPPVGWCLQWNGRDIGWGNQFDLATCRRRFSHRQPRSFQRCCLSTKWRPGWLQAVFLAVKPGGRLEQVGDCSRDKIQTDAVSSLLIDASNRLSQIESSVSFLPSGRTISMHGVVSGSKLDLTIRSFDINLKAQVPLDADVLLHDALSPTACLPNLYEGQTWTVSVLTPLKYPNSPHEILLAKVEGLRRIRHDGRTVAVWLVTYNNNPGQKLSTDKKPHARLWVRTDGVVLKQEMPILNSTMTFVRLPEKDALALAHD